MNRISVNLWFENQAEEAANFYTSIFKHSKIKNITRYGDAGSNVSGRPKGSVMTVSFEINGTDVIALNGGPEFKFNEAVSLIVNCKNQEEVDEYWAKLTDGGQEVACGWLKDRYGVSWQVVPTALNEMMADKDTARSERVMEAMLRMKKLDLRALKDAYEHAQV